MAEGTNRETVREKTLVCGPCLDDGESIEAAGYCVNCAEYLCNGCIKVHNKPRPSRNHVLKSKEEMPSEVAKLSKVKQQTCPIHTSDAITFYCKTHEHLCCEQCVKTSHRSCANVSPISEVTKGFIDSEEFKSFVARVADVKAVNENNTRVAENNEDVINEYYNKCVDDFSAVVVKIKDKDLAKSRTAKDVSQTLLQQVLQWEKAISAAQDANETDQLFILMKLIKDDVILIEENSKALSKETSVERYGFKVCTEPACILGRLVKYPFRLGQISVKHGSDAYNCNIRSMILLNHTTLLISDYSNACVKAVNIEDKTITARQSTGASPWELTMTDNQAVVSSFHGQKKLLYFPTPTADLSNNKIKPYSENIGTVLFDGESVIAGCRDPMTFMRLNQNGEKITDQPVESDNNSLSDPRHSAYNRINQCIVVTDNCKGTLTQITKNGKVQVISKSEKIASAEDVAIDKDGTYIVCSWCRKCVVRVNEDGSAEDIISNLDFHPGAVALDPEKRLLFVAGYSCDFVYIYRV